ncbi:MAG: hypothetical protein OEZ19_00085 [Paracoccaceae bacterium]|nr:hypothetical protein [Paracoccaceae bacterium]
MTVEFQSGYALPGGDQPLKHARILHNGNRHRVKTVTASDEVTGYPGSAANAGDTVDRWRPFTNDITEPDDFSLWTTILNVTVGSDGQTITETTATDEHRVLISHTFTAVETVVAFKVRRQTVPEIRISAFDGVTHGCFFDLRDGTVGTAVSCTGQIVDLGNDEFLCSIYFTALAGAGNVQLRLANGSELVSYTGSTANTILVLRASVNDSIATLRYDLFEAQSGDVICLAGHNFGSTGTLVTLQHDSNEDDTWTDISSFTPSNDSPIMSILVPVTSPRWRLQVSRGVLPEVAVFRPGLALQMQRSFYAGFNPAPMARATQVTGNISGSGELLGRSRKRTILQASYKWENITYAWVRANLDGRDGLIQAAEVEPLFVAWRPGETDDVDYLMRASVTPPQAQGTKDLWTFSMAGEVYAYE